MHWLTRGLIYSFVAAATVLRYLPYPKFRQAPEPEHRREPYIDSSFRSVPLRTEAQEATQMKRAIGYCKNSECEDHAKGIFLLNHGDSFYCPRCREAGNVKPEYGFARDDSKIFKEVRVEFNYDAKEAKYKETAIVRDESIPGRHNVYTLQTPLVKTERRALKVAEAILSNLNRFGIGDGGVPKTTEVILSFDQSRDDFAVKCAQLKIELESSALARNQIEHRV
jgi:hypothetical protein